MMRKYTFLTLILLGFSTNDMNLPKYELPKMNNVIEVNSKEMLKTQPPLLGLNISGGTTIIIPYDFKSSAYDELHKDNYETFVDSKPEQNLQLNVVIDTTGNFYSTGLIYKNVSPKDTPTKYLDMVKEIKGFRTQHVKAYPVFVYNNSNNSNYFKNYGNYTNPNSKVFPMIQEAKDKNGIWKPIEFSEDIILSPEGNLYYELLPKNFLVTSIIKYKGDYKTTIRVKIVIGKDIFYSNEINGTINYSQFDTAPVDEFLKVFQIKENYQYEENGLFFNRK